MSEFFLDFTGVAINEKSQQAPDSGVYQGRITGATVSLKEGKIPQLKVTVICATPNGDAEWSEWLSIQGSDAEKTKKLMQVWGALLLSTGITPEQLKDVKISIEQVIQAITGANTFVEIFNEVKPDGKVATSMSFLKPLDYQAAIAEINKTEGGMEAWAKARAEKRKVRTTNVATVATGMPGFPAPTGFGAAPAGFGGAPAGLPTGLPAGFGAPPAPPAGFGGAPAGFGGAPATVAAPAATPAQAAPAGFPNMGTTPAAPAAFPSVGGFAPPNTAGATGLPAGLPNGMPTGLASIVGGMPGR